MEVHPRGFVESSRATAADDGWGSERACIRLSGEFSARALEGLAEFSHIEVLSVFHQVDPASVIFGARHPRNNPSWPAV
jgi:tRNA (Thr-GGU) A37 N-methylase